MVDLEPQRKVVWYECACRQLFTRLPWMMRGVKEVGHRSIGCKRRVTWAREQMFCLESVGLRPDMETRKVKPQFKYSERVTCGWVFFASSKPHLEETPIILRFCFSALCSSNLSPYQPVVTVLHLLSDDSCCSEAVKCFEQREEGGGGGGIPQRKWHFICIPILGSVMWSHAR